MAKTIKKSPKKVTRPAKAKKAPLRKKSATTINKRSPGAKRVENSRTAKLPPIVSKITTAPVKGYSKQDLEKFKKLIIEKRQEIIEDLEMLKTNMMDVTTGEYTQENNSYSLHMEQGTDTMEREKTFLFASREGKYLQYLEDALQRIARGNYGVCGDCGKLIERGRLEAVPIATLCVDCKIKKGAKSPVA